LTNNAEWAKIAVVVMDGRDIGTVVFPEAEFKIFLTADILVRAFRRQREF
jgi:cytidylate kinase